jgi:predicted PurR-regulated permease PerM
MDSNNSLPSPRWSATTKLVVAITLVAVTGILLLNSLGFIGPLLLSLVLAYLLFPLATLLRKVIRSWRGSVTIIQQFQPLLQSIQNAINSLPDLLKELRSTPLIIGPFSIDLSQLDLTSIAQQIISTVNPILSQALNLVTTVASGALNIIGWIFFAILIAYFILSESNGEPGQWLRIEIPGYHDDVQRFSLELGLIWNAFLRGQLIIIIITILLHAVTLGFLGVDFYFGLALLAGLSRLVPIIGNPLMWIIYGIVSGAQSILPFGLTQPTYWILVLLVAIVVDALIDNFLSPRIFTNTLRVHPAAVFVVALLAANWLGLIGLLLAAPVLATFKLAIHYTSRKMLDLDPWESLDARATIEHSKTSTWTKLKKETALLYRKASNFLKRIRKKNS